MSAALEARNEILSRLTNSIDFTNLPGLSKDQIPRLINGDIDRVDSSPTTEPGRTITSKSPLNLEASVDTDNSDHEWDESKRETDAAIPVGDDVNGLTVQPRPDSYLGATSISAALRVLLKICPSAKSNFVRLGNSFSPTSCPSTHESRHGPNVPGPATSEEIAIDAFFETAHGGLTMIDEHWFRTVFAAKFRKDDPWTALLNGVCAMGSIAAGDDTSHVFYYNRAKQVVGHNVFACGNLEMLQALILLGGGYLHYNNSPNTSYLVMGTAVRMALAMALHRERLHGPLQRFSDQENDPDTAAKPYLLSRAEIRRRTWWALLYADSTAAIQTGRPSVGRWDPSTMDIALPGAPDTALEPGVDSTSPFNHTDPEYLLGVSTRLRAEFTKIHIKIEYRMAQFSRMTAREVMAFETQLQGWYMALPLILRQGGSCPPKLRYSQDLMVGRYLSTRLVMSRSHLLRLAQDPTASDTMTAEDWRVVAMCREVATAMIDYFCSGMVKNRIFVWHASFNLFQACQVTLISLSLAQGQVRPEHYDQELVEACKENIQRALQTYDEMLPYLRTTDKFGDVVRTLYQGIVASPDSTEPSEQMSNPTSVGVNNLIQCGSGPGSIRLTDQPDMQGYNWSSDWFDDNLTFGEQGMDWPAFWNQ